MPRTANGDAIYLFHVSTQFCEIKSEAVALTFINLSNFVSQPFTVVLHLDRSICLVSPLEMFATLNIRTL